MHATEPELGQPHDYHRPVRFSDLVGVDRRPADAVPASPRRPVPTDTFSTELTDNPRNNGFVSAIVDGRRGRRMRASRRGFLRGTIAAAAATTAATTAGLFGPARRVEAQSGIVGTYPRRILQFCPPYNSGDNCQPGCGSSPICTDCCTSDGYFKNDPANGYTLYAGGCGDGDIADGWIWRYSNTCGNCAEIEYRCSDGYVQTDTGPAPFICRAVTDCVPLADGQQPGESLRDAARDTNWRPAGALEVAVDQGSTVAINGWIADGSGVPVSMRIRANNAIVHVGTAGLARPDIASQVRGAGANTGFAVSFPVEPGDYEFCVDALQGVLNATIGCVRMTVGSGGSVRGSGPTGSISSPAATPAPAATPGQDDPDAEPTPTATPEPTPTPGEVVLPVPGGTSSSPAYGALQVVRRSAATTGFVSGWAGDADTDEPAYVEVLVDGESAAAARADLPRADVRRAFGESFAATGFAISFPLPSERAEVCVVAVSPDDGRRVRLGCQELPGPNATGTDPESIEEANEARPSASGAASEPSAVVYGGIDRFEPTAAGVQVEGWAFDPNDRDRTVTIVVRSADLSATVDADQSHPEAQERYGVALPCGFVAELALAAGDHQVDVVAVRSGGAETTLAQRTVTVG